MSKILFYWNDILSSNQKKEHFHISQLAFLWSLKGRRQNKWLEWKWWPLTACYVISSESRQAGIDAEFVFGLDVRKLSERGIYPRGKRLHQQFSNN